jgi:outer membrane protein assembly factor BamE (lipoprotein component of BamABCDE complex)
MVLYSTILKPIGIKMNQFLKLSLLGLLLTTLGGCISINGSHNWDDKNWKDTQEANRKIISELAIGTERSNVLMRLGTPSFSEAFVKDEEEYSVLFYRTHHTKSDGETAKNETTPLIFKNDILIGWGNEVLSATQL